jgi:oligopeptide transport system substrate-binding protein
MRKSLFALALVASIAIGVAAEVNAESVFTRGNRGDPTTLDPHTMANGWEINIALELYMGLTTNSVDGKTIPGAAESWTVSPDGRTYTFTLRKNQVWSDGVALTAADFVYSAQRIFDPKTASPFASLLYAIKNGQAVNTGALPITALGVSAPDANTLRIELEHPAPYLTQLLIHRFLPAPRHVIAAKGADWIKPGNLVSNGPFVLKERVPGAFVRLEKNPRFYDAATVQLDAVVYRPTENLQSALMAVRAGEIDAFTGFAADRLSWVKENMPQYLRLHPTLGVEYLIFNTTKAPFNDPRVRRALSMAIDREVIATNVLGGGEVPAWSIVHPDTIAPLPLYKPQFLAGTTADRRKTARALLANAGFTAASPLRFQLRYTSNETVRKVIVAVAAMWKEISVEAELISSDASALFADVRTGNYQVARADWYPEVIDAYSYLYLLRSTSGPMNQSRYANPAFDATFDASDREPDTDKRLALMRQAEEIAMTDQPVAPLFYYAGRTVLNPRVSGWVDHNRNSHPARYITVK